MPVLDGLPTLIEPLCQAPLLGGREGDPGVVQLEGVEDPLTQERLVALSAAQRQRESQEAEPDVGVLHLRAGRAGQFVGVQKVIEIARGVVGPGVFRVPAVQVGGVAREPGGVRGQVEEGDLAPAVARHVHGIGEQLPHRLVQPHLAPRHHIGQKRGGEGLGDGADLE